MRHGQVDARLAERSGDPPLSDAGRAQAARLGERLAGLAFDVCFASPLARALDTAELVLRGRGVPIEPHACLAEGAYGALEGLSNDEKLRRHPEYYRLGRTVLARLAAAGHTAPGGETRAQFLARAEAAHALVRAPLFDARTRALVVSHGGLLAYLLQLLLGQVPRDDAAIGFEFCGVARVRAYREPPAFGPFAMLTFVPP